MHTAVHHGIPWARNPQPNNPPMPLRSIQLPRARSRAEELYDHLRGAIMSGELDEHERLVENTIAELAAVSRTPVREALHRLEVDGLVQPSPGGGVEVCSLSLDELADLCAVREVLEGMATGLAATARSEMELATLEGILESEVRAFSDNSHDPYAQVRLNHSFHETLWRMSRNRYLAAQLETLRAMIERMQDSTLRSVERQGQALDEHRQIVSAVSARDTRKAEQLGRFHFRNAMAARLVMNATRTIGAQG